MSTNVYALTGDDYATEERKLHCSEEQIGMMDRALWACLGFPQVWEDRSGFWSSGTFAEVSGESDKAAFCIKCATATVKLSEIAAESENGYVQASATRLIAMLQDAIKTALTKPVRISIRWS